jgi:hypothetical protein
MPNILNRFMKKLTRERVHPIISAKISYDSLATILLQAIWHYREHGNLLCYYGSLLTSEVSANSNCLPSRNL